MENVLELGERARGCYAALRTRLETPENIGKLVSIDAETGNYAIGDAGQPRLRLPGNP